ncbi:MAG: polyprenyl synthetase family protein [Planctomycetia bacterium]|nr:polyprenyl synthetase family protein [Planctomycetia bacterium]
MDRRGQPPDHQAANTTPRTMPTSTIPTSIPTPAIPAALSEHLAQLRQLVNGALAERSEAAPGCPASLREAIKYSVLGPGKRLRPILVLLAAEACGCSPERALPAACAVEMVHAYSLVHDDLPAMDDDDLRRGRPTCHKVFGEAMAILAGDALLTRAFEVLATELRPHDVAAACCAALAAAAGPCGMVGGQCDDLDAQRLTAITDPAGQLALLESIHARKTAAMINVSLKLGALVAGASAAEHEALQGYGQRLGLAFQIVDDLLDVGGDEAALGKRVGKDIDRGKLTFPGLLGVDASRAQAAELVRQACEALAPLAPRGERLAELARYVVERDH